MIYTLHILNTYHFMNFALFTSGFCIRLTLALLDKLSGTFSHSVFWTFSFNINIVSSLSIWWIHQWRHIGLEFFFGKWFLVDYLINLFVIGLLRFSISSWAIMIVCVFLGLYPFQQSCVFLLTWRCFCNICL